MPQLNLSIHFWIGLVVFITTGISAGTIHLTNIVPADWIPYATAWSSLFATVGSGYLTAALGLQKSTGDTK